MGKLFSKRVPLKHLVQHETKQHALFRYLLSLGILVAYFIFVAQKYGAEEGLLIALLTWSFFVLSTPVADAGFLVDFPIRILTGLRMIYTEAFVWIVAIGLNIYALNFHPEVYEKTQLLSLFHTILTHPYPYWGIIILSFIGTFLSIRFGDELIDVIKHRDRHFFHRHKYNHQLILIAFAFVATFALYTYFITELGLQEFFS